jgi:hypothetical protein
VWGLRGHLGIVPPGEAFPNWKEATRRALELDPTLPEAHTHAAAQLFYIDWDWAAADSALRRAIDLNPSYPELRVWYGELLSSTGRPEQGLAQTRKALDMDPHNATVQAWVGQQLLAAGRDDEAVAHLELAQAKQIVSRDDEIAHALERGFGQGGYREAMRAWAEIVARRAQDRYIPATRVAGLYAAAGEPDLAMDWLEKGFEARESQMVYLAVSPRWDTLWDHPRFQDLLRRMNLRPLQPFSRGSIQRSDATGSSPFGVSITLITRSKPTSAPLR